MVQPEAMWGSCVKTIGASEASFMKKMTPVMLIWGINCDRGFIGQNIDLVISKRITDGHIGPNGHARW